MLGQENKLECGQSVESPRHFPVHIARDKTWRMKDL